MRTVLALADDHALLRHGLAALLKDYGYAVSFEADNGAQFIEKLKTHPAPQVALMDINMPLMDGFETTHWLKQNLPDIKVLALSMLDDETTIIRMIKAGAKGYVLKDCEPEELHAAIQAVLLKGFYHSELVSGKIFQGLSQTEGREEELLRSRLSEKELEFLKWTCTDLSYKEIAGKMGVSPRTVDGYRDDLHEKLDVKSRIGMVLLAIKNGIVKV